MRKYLIPATLIAILFIRVAISADVRYNGQVLFIWGVLAAFAVFVMIHANLWVGLFLVLAAFSSQFPFITQYSQESFFSVLMGVILYLLCVQTLNTDKAVDWSLNVIAVFAIANVVFLGLQYFDADPIHMPRVGKVDAMVGLMSYPHGCSAMLAICAPAFARRGWIYLSPLLLLGFFLTKTFIGPLAIGIVLLLYGLIKIPRIMHKVGLLAAVASVLITYAVFVDPPDAPWRVRTWKIAMFELFPRHWIAGYGLGFWQIKFTDPQIIERITQTSAKQEFMQQAHNDPLQGLFEMGIGFAVLITGYLTGIWRRFKPEAILASSGLLLSIIASMVGFPMHEAYSAAIIIFWMGLTEVKCRKSLIS